MPEPFHVGELVRLAQAGDQQAATELYAACREPMLRTIRAIIPLRLRKMYDSEDFVQEGMINLFTAKFESEILASPARFWAYLKQLVENRVHDVARKYLATGRFGFMRETAISDREMQSIADESSFSLEDAILLKNLAVDHLNEILNRLKISDRAMALVFLRGYHLADVAKTLSIDQELAAITRIETTLGAERSAGAELVTAMT